VWLDESKTSFHELKRRIATSSVLILSYILDHFKVYYD
jgi:hypothetical protein